MRTLSGFFVRTVTKMKKLPLNIEVCDFHRKAKIGFPALDAIIYAGDYLRELSSFWGRLRYFPAGD